jgi:SAM-dependent methyltransferase
MNVFSIARYLLPMTHYPYSGNVVACPVCDEPSFTPVASIDRRLKRLPTVMCDHCGLLYTNPMPSEAELNTYYEKYYRFDYQLAATKPKRKHIEKREREALARARQLDGLLSPGARTLDFGAGSGEFVALMLDRDHDAHGFEPGETYAKHARERLGERIRHTNWQDASYGPEFDLVTCFHVLEHLSTPIAALERMAQWLKPGGRIYLEVPEMESTLERKGFGSLHFAHVLGFNHHNLSLAAARVGFRRLKTVEPTGIVFERGEVEDQEALAARGLETTRRTAIERTPATAYRDYQLGKIGLRLGAARRR